MSVRGTFIKGMINIIWRKYVHRYAPYICTVIYQLGDISDKQRMEDLKYIMNGGNHQSASDPDNEPTLLKNYEKEVTHG